MKDRLSLGLVAIIILSFGLSIVLASCDALLAAAVRDADPMGTAVPNLSGSGTTGATYANSEGTQSSPTLLVLTTPHSAKLGTNGTSSFYKFTATSTAAFDFAFSDFSSSSSLDYYLYSDSAFSTELASLDSSYGTTTLGNVNISAGATVYLKISNNGYSYSSSSLTFKITITSKPALNEGNASAPVNLVLGTAHASKVGMYSYSSTSGNYSYYKFTTGAGTKYDILIDSLLPSSNSLSIGLYSTATYSYSVNSYSSVTTGVTDISLNANTAYYLKVSTTATVNLTFNMKVQAHQPANEGSAASPISLSVGTTRNSCKVGPWSNSIEGYSYYSFLTGGTSKTYTISVTNLSDSSPTVYYYLYSGSFGGSQVGSTIYNSSGGTTATLNANTTYYLKVFNYDNTNLTFSLLVY